MVSFRIASRFGIIGLSACLISINSSVLAQEGVQFPLQGSVSRQLTLADDLMVEGKYADAADIYRQILNINSKDFRALAGLGMSLGRQFKLDAADEQFDKLLEMDANNPVAHCGKAMVLLNRLQSSSNTVIKNRLTILRDAGRECNRALDADSRVVEAHYLLVPRLQRRRPLGPSGTSFCRRNQTRSKVLQRLCSIGACTGFGQQARRCN